METRSRSRQEVDMIGDTPTASNNGPNQAASTLTHTWTESTEQPPNMGWHIDPSDLPSEHSIEFMRQLENIGWNGGENFFGGKRDEFCFVCGGSMELFGCQTCETCYHASCMSPTLEPEEVPTFWFCPHCVDRELHIPPTSPSTHFTPISTSQLAEVPSSSLLGQNFILPNQRQATNSSRGVPEGQMIDIAGSMTKVREVSKILNPKIPVGRIESKASTAKTASGRTKRSYSPARKRSKYSAYSSEVDKALAVIHKELEAAAQKGRSEDNLKERIQNLEQELRLKDGQIALATRELEMARQNGDSGRLKAEIQELKGENDNLRTLVEKKDGELRDWRTKLKTLLGTEIE